MRTNYDRQLKKLNDEMVEMGSMIEGVIEKAIKALVNQDVDLAQEVIHRDDQIDQQEKDIESLCFKLLLMEQPVATDLRQVSSALKMVTDMERIGDHAADFPSVNVIREMLSGSSAFHGNPQFKELLTSVDGSVHLLASVVAAYGILAGVLLVLCLVVLVLRFAKISLNQ